jgi:hypothetical protein
MREDILKTPTELTDEELDAVAAGCNACPPPGDNNSGTTVQIAVLGSNADDGSNASLITVGNQSA